MDNQTLVVIVLGVLGVAALGVFAYYGKKLAEIAALLEPLIRVVVQAADVKLAPYGAALKPVHEAAEALGTLIDQPDDTLVRNLPEDVIAAARVILRYAEQLTDGVVQGSGGADVPPEPETLPRGKTEAVK